MDPITMAITGALANLGTKVIGDAYDALKAALQAKYGVDSKLVGAVEELESEPDFVPNQDALAGRVNQEKAGDDPQIQQLVQALMEALESTPEGKQTISKYQIDAKNAQIGVLGDDANIEGGISFGGSVGESEE